MELNNWAKILHLGDTALRALNAYIFDIITCPYALLASVIAVGIPILHARYGTNTSWTRPKTILIGYVTIMIMSVLANFILEIILRNAYPATHSTWLQALDTEHTNNPITLLIKLLVTIPFAFGISSAAYGILGGWKTILPGLLGMAIAVGLFFAAIYATFFVVCFAWSACII